MSKTAIFNTEQFIGEAITGRKQSLLAKDLADFHDAIDKEIHDKSVLVIGGAGTIGSRKISSVPPDRHGLCIVNLPGCGGSGVGLMRSTTDSPESSSASA